MNPPEEQQSPDSLDPLPGRLIAGNFRIEKLIGQGAMGNVYRAEQLSLGKAVAVKVLHAHLMSDDKLVGRFKREAKSASRLNHPNSIQIIDSGQDADGTLYIAMELLAGRDLAQIIRDEFPLPLPRVVRVMTQVMAALDEAHAQGVIHRDLKPSNIMLIERRGERDFVKVCDFGIAKATSNDDKDDDRQQMLTIQGLVCGTPEYMSPEQARAEPLDGRADLYSAAIILYQLVTGDIPFKADSPMGIVSRHLAEVPRAPSLRRPDLPIPKAMDDVILRGMAKNRDERFPTAVAFRAALEALVNPSGFATPLPPGIQAAMPTTPAFVPQAFGPQALGPQAFGLGSPLAPGDTAMIPPIPVAQKFGTTADMTGARQPSRKMLTIMAATLLVGGSAAAFVVSRLPPEHAHRGDVVTAERVAVAAPAPPPVVAAPAPVAAAPAPAAAAPPAAEPEPPAAAAAPTHVSTHEHNRRHHAAEHVSHGPAALALTDSPTPTAPHEPTVVSPAPATEPAPPPRGAHEILLEGEKLLAQGEVSDACARGEEAKRLGPGQPAIYKFLGKCYMRAGRATQAHDNYQKYLELAPTASDAPFIKSMIK
jgi:eukaryotic-like serine/threonine-protein kinase